MGADYYPCACGCKDVFNAAAGYTSCNEEAGGCGAMFASWCHGDVQETEEDDEIVTSCKVCREVTDEQVMQYLLDKFGLTREGAVAEMEA